MAHGHNLHEQLASLHSISVEIAGLHDLHEIHDRALGYCYGPGDEQLNSGSVVLFRHLAHQAVRHNPGDPLAASTRQLLADIVGGYVLGGDLMTVPAPVTSGLEGRVVIHLSSALAMFAIAHEYGHILAGHFDSVVSAVASDRPRWLSKQWEQEFEADHVAALVLFGDSWPSFDRSGIVDDDALDEATIQELDAAIQIQAAVAAPMLFFALDHFVARVQDAQSRPLALPSTHPPGLDRADAVIAPMVEHLRPPEVRYWDFAARIRELADELAQT